MKKILTILFFAAVSLLPPSTASAGLCLHYCENDIDSGPAGYGPCDYDSQCDQAKCSYYCQNVVTSVRGGGVACDFFHARTCQGGLGAAPPVVAAPSVPATPTTESVYSAAPSNLQIDCRPGSTTCLDSCNSWCRDTAMTVDPGTFPSPGQYECDTATPVCTSFTGSGLGGRCGFRCKRVSGAAPRQLSINCTYGTPDGNDACSQRCDSDCPTYAASNPSEFPPPGPYVCDRSFPPVCAILPNSITGCSFHCIRGTPAPSTVAPSGPAAPSAPTYTPPPAGPPIQVPKDWIGTNTTVPAIIGKVIRFLAGIAGGLFLAFFIYGGVLYMTSGGEPKQIESAKKALTNAAIGIAIVMFAYTALTFVTRFIEASLFNPPV